MAEHAEQLGQDPQPQGLGAAAQEGLAISGALEDSWGLVDGDPEEVYRLHCIYAQPLPIGEGVIELQAIEKHAAADVDQQMIVLDALLVSLEAGGIVLDSFNDAEEAFQFGGLVRPRRFGRGRNVLDELRSEGRGRRCCSARGISKGAMLA